VRGNHDHHLYRCLSQEDVSVSSSVQETSRLLKQKDDHTLHTYTKWLGDLPFWLRLRKGSLLLCHAAPPSPSWNEHRKKTVSILGHKTGRMTSAGFDERGTWQTSWEKSSNNAFVVYGHITHKNVYRRDQSVCVDTSCWAGNKLSCFRWPERNIISVGSRREDTDIFYADERERPSVDPYT
jgi:diadenosine tetraphosphatase ApaH/serine/threonine PP2A family protein phosphatase